MEKIVYTKASVKDTEVLVETRIDFLTEILGPQKESEVQALREELKTYFTGALADGTYVSYLAYTGNNIAGVGGMVVRQQPGGFKNLNGLVGYVMNMYTVPAFRKKGIAGKLLELLLEAGAEKGIVAFELHATKAGENVYVNNGFKIHAEPTYRKIVV